MTRLKRLAFAPILLLMGCASKQAAPPIIADAGAPATQQQQPAAQYSTQQPGSPQQQPAQQQQGFTLREGTLFHVRLAETLDTKRNRTGDRFTATLDSPVRKTAEKSFREARASPDESTPPRLPED
jgi:hypothetical protein